MKLLLFLLFVLSFASCTSDQKPAESPVIAQADSLIVDTLTESKKDNNILNVFHCDIKPMIPGGYELLDSTTGDLNLDEYRDCILVLKNKNEETDTTGESNKRLMMLVLGKADGTCVFKEKSFNIIWPLGAGGGFREAYTDVVIAKGAFMVEHQGGNHNRYTLYTYFNYDSLKDTWYLEETKSIGIDINDLEAGEEVYRETVKDFGSVKFEDYKSFG